MKYDFTSAIYATLIAFAINIILCPFLIPLLTKLKFGQNVRKDGPQTHLKKTGTPTMGGIMITLSFIGSSLFFLIGNGEAAMVLFVTVCFGLIGFIDDYIKVVKKRSLGLRAYQKVIGQVIVATVFLIYLSKNPSGYFGGSVNGLETYVLVPFTDGYKLDMGILYIPFVYFIIIGGVNSSNLTDGLDGLNAGVTALVATFFTFIAFAAHSPLLPISGAAVGSLLGFLLFNSYPARVIMGDTGSFALGGYVIATALILKMPLFLGIVGIVYVAESLSVMIQVGYFKISGGKRIFKMAPLHHHFELSGYSETKVVALFYIVTTIMCLVGFLGAKSLF